MRGVTDFGHFKITNDKERSDHHMVRKFIHPFILLFLFRCNHSLKNDLKKLLKKQRSVYEMYDCGRTFQILQVFVQANHKYTPYVHIVDSQDHVILLVSQ